MNADQMLTSADIAPTHEVLERELGDLFVIYDRLTARLGSHEFNVRPEWRFYRDGGAWLCKMTRGKKTVFWLSAWKAFLKVAFYFTARSGDGIPALPIDVSLKSAYENASPIGRLVPLVIELRRVEQLDDLFTVAAYKIART